MLRLGSTNSCREGFKKLDILTVPFKLRVIHPVVQEYNLYLLSVIHNSLLLSKNYAINTKATCFDPMGSSSGL